MSTNEQLDIDEEYFSYEKYIWTLLTETRKHRLLMELIGFEFSRRTMIGYPLYRLIIHPKVTNAICIVSGVHGNEIAGPLSILDLVSNYLHEFPKDYRFLIYPMINPSGFDLRQLFNANQRDLNAIYNDTLTSNNYYEVQAFYQDAMKYAPFEAVITLHEDSGREEFYMYGLGKENLAFYHAICSFAKTCIAPWTNAEIEGCNTDEDGLIIATARDHAFDGVFYKMGLTKKSFTFETPGRLECHFRVDLMDQLVLQSINMLSAIHRIQMGVHG